MAKELKFGADVDARLAGEAQRELLLKAPSQRDKPAVFLNPVTMTHSRTIQRVQACYIWRVNNRENSSRSNGLGSYNSKDTLKSREALHFVGDLQQTYSGKGGGACI